MNKSKKIWLVILVVAAIVAALVILKGYTKPGSDYGAGKDSTTEALQQQGSSDELSDIQKDADSTDFGSLDADISTGLNQQ